MKVRGLIILLVLVLAMVPIYFLNRWLQRVMQPRENAGRFFLFAFVNFVLILVYTLLVVGLIVRIFPVR